jgi:hypothetical protein
MSMVEISREWIDKGVALYQQGNYDEAVRHKIRQSNWIQKIQMHGKIKVPFYMNKGAG